MQRARSCPQTCTSGQTIHRSYRGRTLLHLDGSIVGKIIDPESSGSTFPGAKVWWWMVRPINWMTQWLPGAKYGPGTEFEGRSKWEDAMIAQGEEWPFGLAFSYVQQGDGFPFMDTPSLSVSGLRNYGPTFFRAGYRATRRGCLHLRLARESQRMSS